MKTNFVRHTALGLASGLVFILGCARPSAEAEQPRTVVAPTPPPVLVAQVAPTIGQPPAAVTAQAAPAPEAPPTVVAADTNGPAILQRIPPTTRPESVTLTPGLSEVVKLAQAGVGEEVILAFVEKYSGNFNLGADQILYLNDLGVSSTVVTSMLKHDGSNVAAAAAAPAVQTHAVSNVPLNPVYPANPAPAPQAEVAAPAPPPSTEVSYFYDSLSPYGSWVYLSDYGWCWQPTVAVSAPAWRPYSDRGRWYWSDSGWYWNSDYSWGWAAFHYGRWYHHGRAGWVWTPGTVWGPSWVSWRYSEGYCGWAPLPPEAYYRSGFGFTYYGRGVSVGFDFGLTDYHYSFVSIGNFCDYAPYRYYVPRHQVQNIYHNTTVINNYVVGNNNTIINRGVSRETVIARNGANSVREVSVRERSTRDLGGARAGVGADQIERRGKESVVYRPELPKTPPVVRTASYPTRGNASLGQTAISRRNENGTVPSGNNPVTFNRSTVSGGVVGGSPAVESPATRTPRGTENTSRGTAGITRNNIVGGNAGGNTAITPRTESPARGPSDQRGGRSLFGDSGANNSSTETARTAPSTRSASDAAPQRGVISRGSESGNGVSARSATPQHNGAPVPRSYSPESAPSRAVPPPSAPARVETRQPATSSPRAYEQSSRVPAPTYSAPSAPAPSAVTRPIGGSSGDSQPSGRGSSSGGGGGGGRHESGSRGGERGR